MHGKTFFSSLLIFFLIIPWGFSATKAQPTQEPSLKADEPELQFQKAAVFGACCKVVWSQIGNRNGRGHKQRPSGWQ